MSYNLLAQDDEKKFTRMPYLGTQDKIWSFIEQYKIMVTYQPKFNNWKNIQRHTDIVMSLRNNEVSCPYKKLARVAYSQHLRTSKSGFSNKNTGFNRHE